MKIKWTDKLSCIVLLQIITSPISLASNASICSAKDKSVDLIGSKVSFTGRMVSDGIHSTSVIPDACNRSGFLVYPEDLDGSAFSIIRQSIMNVGRPGTVDKEVHVDVDAIVLGMVGGILGLGLFVLEVLP